VQSETHACSDNVGKIAKKQEFGAEVSSNEDFGLGYRGLNSSTTIHKLWKQRDLRHARAGELFALAAGCMRLVDLAQSAVRALGYDVVRLPHQVSNPIDLVELLVRDALNRDPQFFFVQVGANDGVRDDPLRACVLKYRLSGVLVEPLPDLFAKLQHNYRDVPGLHFENCAVGAKSGQAGIYRIREGAPVPDHAHGMASFSRSHLTARKHGIPGLDDYVVETTIAVRTLPEIIAKYGNRHVSLLMIDTEGFDAEIVKMALDAGLRPEIVIYEHLHLPIATQAETLRHLKSEGYRFQEIGFDTYAMLATTTSTTGA
jgi:FkbM family methyltransferase